MSVSDQYAKAKGSAMTDTKITVAALRSVLRDPLENLAVLRSAAELAKADGARMLFAPELMLTGHGGHPQMATNAEPVPEGPLAQAVLAMSAELGIAICVGIAELDTTDLQIYNSQFVVDKGNYLGLQRKINLSGDEYVFFGPGTEVPVFDLGGLRFGITICCGLFYGVCTEHNHLSSAVLLRPVCRSRRR
jgi:predicted amidohydrolase